MEFSAVRNHVHRMPSIWDLRQSESHLSLRTLAQCLLTRKPWLGAGQHCSLPTLCYPSRMALRGTYCAESLITLDPPNGSFWWVLCPSSSTPHASLGKMFHKWLWSSTITFIIAPHVEFVSVGFTRNQWQINWYVVWNKNKWILFYLHCLIFVWGFLPSFSSAVVKFCFNFCHYHKQHPLLIIWVEDTAS